MRYSCLLEKGTCLFVTTVISYMYNLLCKSVWNNGPQWHHTVQKGVLDRRNHKIIQIRKNALSRETHLVHSYLIFI